MPAQLSSSTKIGRFSQKCEYPTCKNVRKYKSDLPDGCHNKKFHRFPRNIETLQKWKKICGISPSRKCLNLYVCVDHFVPTDYSNVREPTRLNWQAVPKPSVQSPTQTAYSAENSQPVFTLDMQDIQSEIEHILLPHILENDESCAKIDENVPRYKSALDHYVPRNYANFHNCVNMKWQAVSKVSEQSKPQIIVQAENSQLIATLPEADFQHPCKNVPRYTSALARYVPRNYANFQKFGSLNWQPVSKPSIQSKPLNIISAENFRAVTNLSEPDVNTESELIQSTQQIIDSAENSLLVSTSPEPDVDSEPEHIVPPSMKNAKSSKIGKFSYRCEYPSCKNVKKYTVPEGGQKKFHRFPRNPETLQKWKKICSISPSRNCLNLYVCADHFVPRDYSNLQNPGRLNWQAVPKPLVS